MSRAYPSMTALLGLLAIAGYQNRDKIGEWLGGLTGNDKPGAPGEPKSSGLDGILAPWRDHAAAAPADAPARDAGGFLGGGLKDLVDQFRNAGHGETVDSWVGSGPNKPAAPHQLETAIGPDVLQALAGQTGLSKEEILSRLSRTLPEAVDRYTPNGSLPAT
ncbi:YidB family protein [Enterovirga sp.]|uniref:YidB family protein n=1 Tax=Enterovirga sp. TaxID=2026350 RepID=UPI002CB21426|nr:YidB family protein [Enterovirga sp.]HMO29086.1 YidB family protein [Enterovirga sp.]